MYLVEQNSGNVKNGKSDVEYYNYQAKLMKIFQLCACTCDLFDLCDGNNENL